jgi:hypothetical protein
MHRFKHARRIDGSDFTLTFCDQIVLPKEAIKSDFKTTCSECIRVIVETREEELRLLKKKLNAQSS